MNLPLNLRLTIAADAITSKVLGEVTGSPLSRLPPSGDVRLTVNMRDDIHQRLKIAAVKQRTTVGELLEDLVEQTSGRNTGKGEGEGFYLRMPEDTLSAIKIKAAKENTTARMLVLSALQSAGYPVPDFELVDRRRK
jgi:hypothetical protein